MLVGNSEGFVETIKGHTQQKARYCVNFTL